MPEKKPLPKKKLSADWLVGGILTKIGDTVDRFLGRRRVPSSSIATSELVERIKKLLDSEAKKIPGKGTVVPHNIKLKMQWNKFSDDAEASLAKLETALLTAAADHINDSLYYTYAPLTIEVKTDYFTEGVILLASFDKFDDEEREVEMNVTVPSLNVADAISNAAPIPTAPKETYIATFEIKGLPKEKRLEFGAGGRLSVGRTGESDLQIDDASVSKLHASLALGDDGNLSVADTGSTNGTFINDERISYGKATPFEVSDRLRFGLISVGFEYVPRPPETDPVEPRTEEPVEETVEIDGFEFKRKVSPETATDTSPAIPFPSQSLKIEPDLIEEGGAKPEANALTDAPPKETSPAIPIPHQSLNIKPILTHEETQENGAHSTVAEQPNEFETKS